MVSDVARRSRGSSVGDRSPDGSKINTRHRSPLHDHEAASPTDLNQGNEEKEEEADEDDAVNELTQTFHRTHFHRRSRSSSSSRSTPSQRVQLQEQIDELRQVSPASPELEQKEQQMVDAVAADARRAVELGDMREVADMTEHNSEELDHIWKNRIETRLRTVYFRYFFEQLWRLFGGDGVTDEERLSRFLSACQTVRMTEKTPSLLFNCFCKPGAGAGARLNRRDRSVVELFGVRGIQVFMKLTGIYKADFYKRVERRILRYITNPMVEQNETPHLLVCYEAWSIPQMKALFEPESKSNLIQILQQHHKDELAQQLQTVYEEKFKAKLAQSISEGDILLMEHGQGRTLHQTLKPSGQITTEEFQVVMFQILYTLCAFKHRRLTHYDLHFDNIFCDRLNASTERKCVYFISPKEYVVTHNKKWFPKLFDFDNAYVEGLYKSDEIKQKDARTCQNFGMCAQSNYDADLWKVMSILNFIHDDNPATQSVRKYFRSVLKNHSTAWKQPPNPNDNLWVRLQVLEKRDPDVQADEDLFTYLVHYDPTTKTFRKPILKKDLIPPVARVLAGYMDQFIRKRYEGPARVYSWDEFDPAFAPGTHNWDNLVFAYDPAWRKAAAERLQADYVAISF